MRVKPEATSDQYSTLAARRGAPITTQLSPMMNWLTITGN